MKHASPDALDEYVFQLEKEVNKYLTKDINYGKAAKRMYNVFRLTGRYEEAAYLRELFDEPTTMLYQVWSLIRTIDDSFSPGSAISMDVVLSHADELIISVITALEGDQETEIVRRLLKLRDSMTRQETTDELSAETEAAREHVINIVNNFFYEKMNSIPTIKAYMDDFQKQNWTNLSLACIQPLIRTLLTLTNPPPLRPGGRYAVIIPSGFVGLPDPRSSPVPRRRSDQWKGSSAGTHSGSRPLNP
jgi:hypothetical protein